MSGMVQQFVVVPQTALKKNYVSRQVALFGADGEPLSVEQSPTTMLLTGFVAGSPIDLAPTDTVLEAFEKVQGLIFNLISRVEALEAP